MPRRTSVGLGAVAASWLLVASIANLGSAQPPIPASATVPASQNAPTSSPATQPAVDDIRRLMQLAMTMKDDPNRAHALMVQAAQMAGQLPPGADVRSLIVEFTPDKGQIDHLIKPTASKVIQETKKLSPHIELRETYLCSTYPFVGLADNGKGFIFPKPITDKVLKEQHLQRDGNDVFSVVNTPRKETRWKRYFVSPDETAVVLEDWLTAKPTGILYVNTGKIVVVDAPTIDGHDNVYPLRFVEWGKDSVSFVTQATGTYVSGTKQFLAYRELWRVQADSGKAERTRRQEQPWKEKLKWDDQ